MASELPLTLLDLLSNSVILNNTVPYLPLSSIFSLARTSKSFQSLVHTAPDVFRCIDLSPCRGPYVPWISRIDTGGRSWRAERMDENLTEDEFNAGPLRGVLSKLRRSQILKKVQALVLDGLASVTNDLLHEIVTSSGYHIRLLSIRRCVNVNEDKLQQLLTYICRPSRPEGTPCLQGLYFFTDPVRHLPAKQSHGVTTIEGAQLGSAPSNKATSTSSQDYWYAPIGQLIVRGHKMPTSWEQTLNICKGIIWFDAVLCSHMHADMASVAHKDSPEFAAMATIALGPDGCASCGRAPSDAPIWGESELQEFPLLWPPPHSAKMLDAIRPPPRQPMPDGKSQAQRLIVSCSWCMYNRHCDSCHRWWCSDCYDPKRNKNFQTLEALRDAGVDEYLSGRELSLSQSVDQNIKRRFKPVVTRECWECGRVCTLCAPLTSRKCRCCKSDYCILHNTGCDEITCDWCAAEEQEQSTEIVGPWTIQSGLESTTHDKQEPLEKTHLWNLAINEYSTHYHDAAASKTSPDLCQAISTYSTDTTVLQPIAVAKPLWRSTGTIATLRAVPK